MAHFRMLVAFFVVLTACGDADGASDVGPDVVPADTVVDTRVPDAGSDSAAEAAEVDVADTAPSDSAAEVDAADTAPSDSAPDAADVVDVTETVDARDTTQPDVVVAQCPPVSGVNLPPGTSCDPAEQACTPGYGCYPRCDPARAHLGCFPPADGCDYACIERFGPGLTRGQPCQYTNDCAPGLACLVGKFSEVCAGALCCLPYCSVDDPACPERTSCVGSYDPDPATPGYEDVGLCLADLDPDNTCVPILGSNLPERTPCDPVRQGCHTTLGCYVGTLGGCDFECLPISADKRVGEVCAGPNECARGLACRERGLLEYCDGPACCIEHCSLAAPTCNEGTRCVPWYAPDAIAPGYEDLGICIFSPGLAFEPATLALYAGTQQSVRLVLAPAPDAAKTFTLLADEAVISVPIDATIVAATNTAYIDITGVGAGTTTLTATDGDFEATVEVTVFAADAQPKVVALEAAHTTVTAGSTVQLTLTLDLPARPEGTTVTLDADGTGAVGIEATVQVPPGAMTATFEVRAEAAGAVTITASAGGGESSFAFTIASAPEIGLVLAEVFYNPAGDDDGLEWIRLYNGTNAPIDLSGYSISWRGVSFTNGGGVVALTGTIDPFTCFIVGGPLPSGPVTQYTLAFDFEPDIQNGGTAAGDALDAVALYDRPAVEVTELSVPIDVVAWGVVNTNHVLGPSGQLPRANASSVSGESVMRSTASTWVAGPPSGACNAIME